MDRWAGMSAERACVHVRVRVRVSRALVCRPGRSRQNASGMETLAPTRLGRVNLPSITWVLKARRPCDPGDWGSRPLCLPSSLGQ